MAKSWARRTYESSGSDIQTRLIDNSAVNNQPLYIGVAASGTLSSAAAWTIQKLLYDGNGNASTVSYGSVTNGIAATNLVWDNRASYTYS